MAEPLFELDDVTLTRAGAVVLPRPDRLAPGRSQLRRRAVGIREVDAPAPPEPARRSRTAARCAIAAATCASTTRWSCGARSAWCRSCPALLAGHRRGQRPLRRRASPDATPTSPRMLELAGLDAAFAERDAVAALGRRAAARDAGPRAGARAGGPAAGRADVGARRAGARRGRGARCRACASELSCSLVLVTHDLDQAARLADWVVRLELGGAWSGRARRGAAASVTSRPIDISARPGRRHAGAGRRGGGGLVLAASRARARTSAIAVAALVHPADRDRLRDQLRSSSRTAWCSCSR